MTIDIHKLKPGDILTGFNKTVKKIKWTLDYPYITFVEGGAWDASQVKEVSIVTEVVNE